jgi:hypothetical protein
MSHPIYSDPDWMQKFLHNAAKYFENRPTYGEDTAHWANTYNAEKCRKIADEIEKLRAALRGLLEWAGPIAGDTRIVEERAHEEETVAAAYAALGEKEQTND